MDTELVITPPSFVDSQYVVDDERDFTMTQPDPVRALRDAFSDAPNRFDDLADELPATPSAALRRTDPANPGFSDAESEQKERQR
jgi:hypothetical protein